MMAFHGGHIDQESKNVLVILGTLQTWYWLYTEGTRLPPLFHPSAEVMSVGLASLYTFTILLSLQAVATMLPHWRKVD